MATYLTDADLPSHTRDKMSAADLRIAIEDAHARAVGAAPCLAGSLSEGDAAQVRAILRGVVSRHVERVTSSDRQMTSGPFSYGPAPGANEPRAMLWPSEVEELQDICGRAQRVRMGWLV